MNTPAHVAASILLWHKQPGWPATLAVIAGALLPDLTMVGFYCYAKLWLHSSEQQIWSQLYFQDNWQLIFDLFNSIPIVLGLLMLCYYLNPASNRAKRAQVLGS